MKKIETDKDGRVRIDNQVMAKLKAIPDGNYYKEKIIKDKNLMGFIDTALKAKTKKKIILKK